MNSLWMSYVTPAEERKPHKRLFIYDARQWDEAEHHKQIGYTGHSNCVWDGPEWGLKGPPRKHRDMLGVYPPAKEPYYAVWYMRCL